MIPHFIAIFFMNNLYFFIFYALTVTNPASKGFTKEID